MAETNRWILNILSADERKPFGNRGGTVLHFKACIEGSEDVKAFQTFDKSMDVYIKSGKIEADVMVKPQGDFINRTIKQIYIDDKPVIVPQAPKTTQYNRGKSLEEIRSIEKQVSLYCAKDITIALIPTLADLEPGFVLNWADKFCNWLKGGQDVKTETPKEYETDDPAEILEPEDEPEVSWESIRPKLSELYNQKALTMDKTLKQLASLGADISSRNVKVAFESLNLENKQKFAKIITTKKED